MSICCFGCHYLFYYAQFYSTLWSIGLNVQVTNVTLTGELLDGLVNVNVSAPDDSISEIVQTYDFERSVEKLRETGAYWSATALFCFSGLWPHIKLCSIHILWYLPNNAKVRTYALRIFEFFGRWSALDVFLMLYLILIIDITIANSTTGLIDNVATNLPGFIDNLNGTEFCQGICHGLIHTYHKIDKSKLTECLDTCDLLLLQPQVRDGLLKEIQDLNSTGDLDIQVKGESDWGLYYFSTAVWFSLVISCCMNAFDHSVNHPDTRGDKDKPVARSRQALCCHSGVSQGRRWITFLLTTGSMLLLYFATTVDVITTAASGGTAHVLDMLTNTTDFMVIEHSTMGSIGDSERAPSSGPFLAKDMLIFTVFGPALVFVCTWVLLVCPLRPGEQRVVHELMKLASSFSAIEVMVFMNVILTYQLPIITGVNFITGLFPKHHNGKHYCDLMERAYNYEEPCFQIDAILTMPIWYILSAAFVSVHLIRGLCDHMMKEARDSDPDSGQPYTTTVMHDGTRLSQAGQWDHSVSHQEYTLLNEANEEFMIVNDSNQTL